jgi:predicted nucleic-acid-binding protein
MANKVCELLENTEIIVRCEVLAEVVYVLNKVYSMPKLEIADCVKKFLRLPNVEADSEEALFMAMKTYAEKNLDFVDCVLYGFYAVYSYDVFTFDKKLNSMFKY